MQNLLVALPAYPPEARARDQIDALAHEEPLHYLRRVGVLTNQNLRRHLELGHARADALKALGQLAAETLGSVGQLEDVSFCACSGEARC